MNENKLKHLEFIQNVITRLNGNSFLIKGWSVTIVAALFALAAKDSDTRLLLVAYVPVFAFWFLDGFFLSYERRYRDLYEFMAERPAEDTNFSLKMPRMTWNSCWLATTFLSVNTLFHGLLFGLVVFLMAKLIPIT
jgi:hypothetical protein